MNMPRVNAKSNFLRQRLREIVRPSDISFTLLPRILSSALFRHGGFLDSLHSPRRAEQRGGVVEAESCFVGGTSPWSWRFSRGSVGPPSNGSAVMPGLRSPSPANYRTTANQVACSSQPRHHPRICQDKHPVEDVLFWGNRRVVDYPKRIRLGPHFITPGSPVAFLAPEA